MSKAVHTGTGRIGWIKMRPMSLWESQESTGDVSLAELFTTPEQNGNQDKRYKIFYRSLHRNSSTGYWPERFDKRPEYIRTAV